jgi:hypothetical protein
MNKFKHLALLLLSVSILVVSFGSVGNCWQPPNPVMGPNMVPMGPPMQGPPMGPPMQGPPMQFGQSMQPPPFCGPGQPMGMMPCQPRQNLLGPLTISVGYIDTFKNSQIRREVASNGITVSPSYEFKTPTTGAWLGASQSLYVGQKCGIVGSGGILVPSKTHGTVVLQGTPGAITPSSDIDIDNQWGRVDGAAFCEVFRTENCNFGFLILGGFRWDYFEQKVKGDAVNANGASVGNFKDDLTVNSYLPYLGGQFSLSSCNSSANVRFIVSPGLWGEMKLDDTNLPQIGSGHLKAPFQWGNFWELYSVYSMCLFQNVEAGAYFDWTFLELVSEARSNTFVTTLETAVAAAQAITVSNQERIHLHRNTWSVGGTLKIDFDFGI